MTSPGALSAQAEVVEYPGARAPDRSRHVLSHGLRIAVQEWGDPAAPPLLMAHGGFDFARTFDVFAPMLADGGWRVVSWDQRGHGDSEHASLYSWEADVRDALAVLESVTREPVPMVGHSKGGAVLTSLIECCPTRASHLVNIDGLPSRSTHPDVTDHERTRMRAEELAAWLDRRRRATELVRRPGSIDELAKRRARMNPRLSPEWLRYLVTVGARRDPDGWRWKVDPIFRFGGFGPWRPEWYLRRLPALPVPLLGVLSRLPEEMSWVTTPEVLRPYLPRQAQVEVFEDSGHFIHIEHPRRVADLALEFLS